MQIGTIVKYQPNNDRVYWKPQGDAIGIIVYGDDTQYRVKWNSGDVGWYIPSDLEVICE